MTNTIRAKFEELHPYKEGSNKSLYESLYAIFKEGWENGAASDKNPAESDTVRFYGFCIPVIESEAGWGSKQDGYMVGFTVEDLKERQKDFERGNTGSYGLYYERPNRYTPVELTQEAFDALMKATEKHCTLWYDCASDFVKGEEND